MVLLLLCGCVYDCASPVPLHSPGHGPSPPQLATPAVKPGFEARGTNVYTGTLAMLLLGDPWWRAAQPGEGSDDLNSGRKNQHCGKNALNLGISQHSLPVANITQKPCLLHVQLWCVCVA